MMMTTKNKKKTTVKKQGRTHLIIGDAHAKPGVSNRRFKWLGRMIDDIKPDVVVQIGDWFDMPSLSSYDVGKKSFEGRTYNADIGAGKDAIRAVRGLLSNQVLRNTQFEALGGNHDDARIKRVVEGDRKLEGTISVLDMGWVQSGWSYTPFLSRKEIDGIVYQHYFTTGVMGRPVGGENPALRLLQTRFASSIQGHDHLFSTAHRFTNTGRKIWGFTCGCYLDPDQIEEYAGEANQMWDRGILVLTGVNDGDIESFKWVGIGEISRTYGKAGD